MQPHKLQSTLHLQYPYPATQITVYLTFTICITRPHKEAQCIMVNVTFTICTTRPHKEAQCIMVNVTFHIKETFIFVAPQGVVDGL